MEWPVTGAFIRRRSVTLYPGTKHEYADRSIRSNAIAPGATITPTTRAWGAIQRRKPRWRSTFRRAGDADEMAAVAAFLSSCEAGYVTGRTLYLDGE